MLTVPLINIFGFRMSDKLSGDALVNSLRQLIISFEPLIKEADSRGQAESTLLHLEENDALFHRYVFKKVLTLFDCFLFLIKYRVGIAQPPRARRIEIV